MLGATPRSVTTAEGFAEELEIGCLIGEPETELAADAAVDEDVEQDDEAVADSSVRESTMGEVSVEREPTGCRLLVFVCGVVVAVLLVAVVGVVLAVAVVELLLASTTGFAGAAEDPGRCRFAATGFGCALSWLTDLDLLASAEAFLDASDLLP